MVDTLMVESEFQDIKTQKQRGVILRYRRNDHDPQNPVENVFGTSHQCN